MGVGSLFDKLFWEVQDREWEWLHREGTGDKQDALIAVGSCSPLGDFWEPMLNVLQN